jgi:hypothetical protein
MAKKITAEGVIERDGNCFVVRAPAKAHEVEGRPEIECENPEVPPEKRIYRRRFENNRIYLPHQYEMAVRDVLTGPDVIVLAMTGLSVLSEEKCNQYQIKPGAYEAACERALLDANDALQAFEGIDIRFAHGASDLGVDRANLNVATRLNKLHLSLGHSCPRFMLFVPDNGMPVYVAKDQKAYSDFFTSSLDILLACNGRLQAFEMDMMATIRKRKKVIRLNILKLISPTGGPPAYGPDGSIEDAIAVYEATVHDLYPSVYGCNDPFEDGMSRLQEKVVSLVRPKLTVQRGFSNRRRT